jgi:peptidoglycan/LPS O-acetylase OafA/YrhL
MLRGLASSFVFIFHLFNLSNGYLGNESVWDITYYGKFGVQFFFVISGFVITYSMINAGYRTKDFFTFLGKRIIRIEPPYLIVLALTVIFLWVRVRSGIGRGDLTIPSWQQVVLHVGYLIPFTHYSWLSIVFWTLAIEFQFYLLFSLLINSFTKSPVFRWVSTAALIALFFLSQSEFHFFYWAPVFLLGINLALFKNKKIAATELGTIAALMIALVYYKLGLVICLFALVPFLIIFFDPHIKLLVLQFLGRISYSLYLLHTLVAFAIINIGIRVGNNLYQRIVFGFLALSCTLIASWLLYRFVEKPCQRLATSIRYKS